MSDNKLRIQPINSPYKGPQKYIAHDVYLVLYPLGHKAIDRLTDDPLDN